jgi:aminopeptidase N
VVCPASYACDPANWVIQRARKLLELTDFDIRKPCTPQKWRACSAIFSFCSANYGALHRADAVGYVFLSQQMELHHRVGVVWIPKTKGVI